MIVTDATKQEHLTLKWLVDEQLRLDKENVELFDRSILIKPEQQAFLEEIKQYSPLKEVIRVDNKELIGKLWGLEVYKSLSLSARKSPVGLGS